jgi:hypothetical protein
VRRSHLRPLGTRQDRSIDPARSRVDRERLIPLLDKIDVTVDAANAELLRIDGILTQFEEVSDRVSSTTHAVQGAVNAPLDAVNAVGTGVRDVITEWRRNRKNPQSTQ